MSGDNRNSKRATRFFFLSTGLVGVLVFAAGATVTCLHMQSLPEDFSDSAILQWSLLAGGYYGCSCSVLWAVCLLVYLIARKLGG